MSNLKHSCPGLKELQIEISRGSTALPWMLKIQSIASKETVKMGEADFIGEMLCSHEVEVKYCPSCGDILETI